MIVLQNVCSIAFGRYAESLSTFVDDMFGGTLVSSVICHRCHTVCYYVILYVSLSYYMSHYVIMSHGMLLCHIVCH